MSRFQGREEVSVASERYFHLRLRSQVAVPGGAETCSGYSGCLLTPLSPRKQAEGRAGPPERLTRAVVGREKRENRPQRKQRNDRLAEKCMSSFVSEFIRLQKRFHLCPCLLAYTSCYYIFMTKWIIFLNVTCFSTCISSWPAGIGCCLEVSSSEPSPTDISCVHVWLFVACMHVLHVVRCFHCERFEFANLYTPIASGFKDWLLSFSCQRALIVKNTQPYRRRKANFSTVYGSLCSALVLFGVKD